MISSDFYTTDQTTTSGFQLTGLINTIKADYNEEFGNPYMMGYIPYENIPTPWKPFTIEYNVERNTIIAKSAMIPQNVGWGYVANLDNNLQTGYSDMYEYSNIWARIATTSDPKIRFINAGEIPKLNTTGVITFFNIVIKHDLSTDEYVLNTTARQHTNIYVKDFIDFLNGNTTMEFLINGNNVAIECVTDDDGLIVYNDGTNDYYIIITYFACSQDTGNVQSFSRNYFNPFIKFTVQNEDDENTILEIPYTYGISGSGYSYIVNATTSVVSEQSCSKFSDYYFGNISEGEYDLTDAQTLQTDYYKRFGNTFITKGSNNRYFVVCNYNSDDLMSMLTIVNKYKNNAQADSYLNGYNATVSVAIFDANNVPQRIRLSDDYQSLLSRLQSWQLLNADITENEFDPKDIPPYQPTPGDDDKNTESGDKIPNQFDRTVGVTSNFVTNYLMTEGQISKLGEVLWTSWADDTVTMDMVNNFYGKFHDATGSWNVSDALQFIVSCRLFPCSLATLVNTTQVTSIPIGTGAFALQCGTSSEPHFFIANEATAILNCGEIYVPITYNDYRDFENTKITAYLPFCGSVELNPQDVVDKWIGCTYAIDLFDGSCKAFIYTLSGDDVGYEGAYYNVAIKQGQCGFLIPLSATQAGQVASRQKVDSYTDGALLFNAGMSVIGAALESTSGGSPDTGLMKAISTIGNYGFQSDILSAQRSGRPGIAAPYLSGGSGFTDFHQPASAYIQIRRSYYQEPIEYEHSAGYPVNAQKYGNLSQFSGFITCSNVDISGFTCHEDERAEIKALLESGVYL
jgi:hypothetical protein